MAFSGTGTLELAHSLGGAYGGTITGFGSGDAIILDDIAFSKGEYAIWCDGKLTIYECGIALETIAISGNYGRNSFAVIDDGGKAEVVFGSRFLGAEAHRVLYYWHFVGNKIVTTLSNICTNLNLTDVEVGHKAFSREILQKIKLCEDRFGFDLEITAKVARSDGVRIYEVPISYQGRTYAEGKKIGWKDGIAALWHIIKYNFFSRAG